MLLIMKLLDNIQYLKGVGVKRAESYKKLGVESIYSLLRYYPRSYMDYTTQVPISEAIPNEFATIKARIYKKTDEQRVRKNLVVYKIYATDDVSNIELTIFNSKYLFDALKIDETYVFYGKITGSVLRREMSSPVVLTLHDASFLQAIYPLTEGLSSKMIRSNIRMTFNGLGDQSFDPLTDEIKIKHELCHLRYALENIHFPKDETTLELAKKRLIFEELFTLQLGLLMLRSRNHKKTSASIKTWDLAEFVAPLAFELTDAQKNAINDCVKDMRLTTPMNRLIQGDVGSGKTMIAAAMAFVCHQNGFQSAIMAPTEILAGQHYTTLCQTLEPLGVKVALLKGSLTKKQKETIKQEISDGVYGVVVGTHALVQQDTEFKNLAFVVTDEQHRFGVEQRAILAQKGNNPHIMVMSATPIPRTLALIIYGDLDVSVIHELPKGRIPIETYAISTNKRTRAYGFIKEHLLMGKQAYIVCPLIEENEENPTDLKNVIDYAKDLSKNEFSNFRVGVLHSKLKPLQKENIMKDFKDHKLDLLVSTTVIEVGVDVPNAVIMLIENAERFGLSQLHQLRGRVGRGVDKSYCILVSDNQGEQNKTRLKIMSATSDGFLISEEDLKLRGPGDFFGSRQHGLPALKIANMVDDISVLRQTQAIAKEILSKDKDLSLYEHKGLNFLVSKLFEKKVE